MPKKRSSTMRRERAVVLISREVKRVRGILIQRKARKRKELQHEEAQDEDVRRKLRRVVALLEVLKRLTPKEVAEYVATRFLDESDATKNAEGQEREQSEAEDDEQDSDQDERGEVEVGEDVVEKQALDLIAQHARIKSLVEDVREKMKAGRPSGRRRRQLGAGGGRSFEGGDHSAGTGIFLDSLSAAASQSSRGSHSNRGKSKGGNKGESSRKRKRSRGDGVAGGGGGGGGGTGSGAAAHSSASSASTVPAETDGDAVRRQRAVRRRGNSTQQSVLQDASSWMAAGVHPSWAAQQLRKQKEASMQGKMMAASQGTKITFADSDSDEEDGGN